jgi:ATP adenylyltransferase
MELIWAPWRIEYIRMEKPAGCILCDKPGAGNDAAHFILYRAKENYIMLNGYPYNPGHLLIVPYRHVASLEELTSKERHEHIEVISRSIEVLKKVFKPAGFNMGMNIGNVGGAGINDHVHSHVVPRWQGDNNFMPIIGDTRVVPQALEDTYKQLEGRF